MREDMFICRNDQLWEIVASAAQLGRESDESAAEIADWVLLELDLARIEARAAPGGGEG